jgi:glycosyltransferase involved in cell wall biosynthesis
MNRRSIVVIPAFNEETTVRSVVENCTKYCDVLVVNDGSTDDTSIAASLGGAIVLTNDENKGYEYSLNVAYKYAVKNKYDIMITMDADGQLPTEMLPPFLKAIEEGASVVIGNRMIKPRFSEKILAFLAKKFSSCNDPYCGMKGYCLDSLNRNEFSQYNSIGTSLALDYIEARLPCENIDIEIKSRIGESKFGGKLSSELKLFRSMAIGSFRLLKTWVNR